MEFIGSFESARLVAERPRPGHIDDLRRMHRDARVMATLGGVRNDEETQAFLDQTLVHWARHGFGLWIFRDRVSGAFAGRGGLRHVEVEGADEIELAYALLPPYWRQGLATEMGGAILDAAFRRLGLAEIVCFTQATNHASRRVMEKLGFRYERDFVRAALPHVLCRLKRPASVPKPHH